MAAGANPPKGRTTTLRQMRLLAGTDRRLFHRPSTASELADLDTDDVLAERIEAFIGRYGKLQDTPGDKLLPNLLTLVGVSHAIRLD